MADLPAFTLLNTRPAHQAAGLQALAQAAGGAALPCPTLKVAFQGVAAEKLAQLAEFDTLIFISANAVQGLQTALQRAERVWQPGARQTCFAIGRATLKAAETLRWKLHSADAHRFDSEALLAHPDLQRLQGKKVLLIKGQNGRELIAETLQQRGAEVEAWEVYQRVPCELCAETWQNFRQSRHPLVLASSVAGLQALLSALSMAENGAKQTQQAGSAWLLQQPLVTFSARIADWAEAQGWQGDIQVVDTQSDAGIIACIQQHWPQWFAAETSKRKQS
ncbi:uroporphyrinogen-III synthase [Thiomicrorhabdus cannonii]|uniref:uroporphyrinogen-III synthase n=1 Tax=Thiomicrorhabdus cannonii TaxID=2748011 RepID=UPI0015BDB515|nr:uroporphyrinogen-III synthase [Thiomicrorhabdus cannonii]